MRPPMEQRVEIPSRTGVPDGSVVILLGSILALALARILFALVPPVTAIEAAVWVVLGVDLCAVAGYAAWLRSGDLVRRILLVGISIAGVVAGLAGVTDIGTRDPSALLSLPALVCYGYLTIGSLAGRALSTVK
jgi:hypothetical protein